MISKKWTVQMKAFFSKSLQANKIKVTQIYNCKPVPNSFTFQLSQILFLLFCNGEWGSKQVRCIWAQPVSIYRIQYETYDREVRKFTNPATFCSFGGITRHQCCWKRLEFNPKKFWKIVFNNLFASENWIYKFFFF